MHAWTPRGARWLAGPKWLSFVVLCSACLSNDFADGQFLCEPAAGPRGCPAAQTCVRGVCRWASDDVGAGASDQGGAGAGQGGGGEGGSSCTPGSETIFPKAVYNDNSAGGRDSADPQNAANDSDASATASLAVGEHTARLDATSFQFHVPAAAIVDSLLLRVERSRGSGANAIRDQRIQLLKNNQSGDDVPDTSSIWPSEKGYASYHGLTPTWGLSWTPAELNSAALKVRIRAEHTGSMDIGAPNVHRVEVTAVWSCP